MNPSLDSYGPWAVITGASQGIGRGFAESIARAGLNVVLVSRRPEKLASLADELSTQFGVQTRVVAADLSVPGAGRGIIDEVRDLDVGLLISNAGAARMGGFLQNTLEDLSADLVLNTMSHLELAHAFGSKLRHEGRKGGILLVSSTAALQPIALAANYSASKAYVRNLGESLHREFGEVGIDVSVLLPGPTDTDGLNHRSDIAMGNLPMSAMSVDALVREGLGALKARRASHIAGFVNRVSAWMPRSVLAWMFSTLLGRNASPKLLAAAPIAQPPLRSLPDVGRSAVC